MFPNVPKLIAVSLALTFSGSMANAASPETKQDSIDLVASVETRSTGVQQIRFTEQQGRDLLYLENIDEHSATIVDVTDSAHPAIVRQVVLPGGVASVEALAGDAALVADSPARARSNIASLSIVYLGDSDNDYQVRRTFRNVTALAEDNRRGLIYLMDQDGLKILQKVFQGDAAEREFEKRLRYDR